MSLTCSPGCVGCVRLSQKVVELEKRISTLHQIHDHERDVDTIFSRTFATTDGAQLADAVSCQPGANSISGSPSRLGVPGACTAFAAEEERWLQLGAKPKAPLSSTPLLQGAWVKVGSGKGGGTRGGGRRSPPPSLSLSNRFGALELDFPPLPAPGRDFKGPSRPLRDQLNGSGHPRHTTPQTEAGTHHGALTSYRCSPGGAQPITQQVPEGSSAQLQPTTTPTLPPPPPPPPTTLIVGDSIIRNVRMRGALTFCYPGATVLDIARHIPDLIQKHTTASPGHP
nr:uncharacterized protein LOC129152925 [Nothobranchius furzeri]